MGSRVVALTIVLIVSLCSWAGPGDGKWRTHVPEKEKVRVNPYAEDEDARAAGEKLFMQNCAQCHGRDAMGSPRYPSLVSGRLVHTSDGELQWLLRNGSLRNGMPSWSSLPEQQRWQIITYLRQVQRIAMK